MKKINNRHESYDNYINFQKQKTEDPVRREKWLGEEWDSKIQGFVEIFTSNQDISFEPDLYL